MLFLRINGNHLPLIVNLGSLHLQCRLSQRMKIILAPYLATVEIMIKRSFLIFFLLVFALTGCSPKFDWREVKNSEVAFSILMPAKPNSYSRDLRFSDQKLALHMTAAEVDQLSFAVAYTQLNSSDLQNKNLNQEKLLNLLKEGMLKNIQASQFKLADERHPKDTLIAVGVSPKGKEIKMVAKFLQHGSWVIQIVVIGDEKKMSTDILDMYFGSFKFENHVSNTDA